MKSVYSLVFLAVLLWGNSPPPSEAAFQSGSSQPLGNVYASFYNNSLADPLFTTFLPLSFANFRPTCHGIPENILTLFGPSLLAYYPLWETGGSAVVDLGPYHLSGSYGGDPLLNHVPALCGSAPWFDGLNDRADVYSAGLASAFNGDEGTLFIQLKVEPQEWVDGKNAYYLALRVNDNNNIVLHKSGQHQLEFAYTAGGKRFSATYNDIATDNWVTYAITWSKSNDRFLGYLAGESICPEPLEPGKGLVCPPQSGLGEWSGELTTAEIGAYLGSADAYANASISSVMLLDREATPQEIRQVSAAFGAKKVLSILGDSISRVYYNSPWPVQAVLEYGGGNQITLKSHAVSARGVLFLNGMDDQTAAASLDDADIIIIALGVVDDNAGDMDALQAKAEENIAKLILSNPRATLYYLNVLPVWDEEEQEIDKSNIRVAIKAACASTGITCWDTYSTPWITFADTHDGIHLNPAGQAKVASQVLQRIQPPINGTSQIVP